MRALHFLPLIALAWLLTAEECSDNPLAVNKNPGKDAIDGVDAIVAKTPAPDSLTW